MFRQRLRIFFTKEGPLRFISHHDLMRLFERALRRTGLPLKMSEGFNPRPQLSFPVALALGIDSQAELFEVELTEWVSPTKAKAALERQAPEGIGIKSVDSVRYGEKADVTGAEFAVRLGRVPPELSQMIEDFMNAREVFITRRGKSGDKKINARDYVRHAILDGDMLRFTLDITPAGSVRPEEVLEAVLQAPAAAVSPFRVTRTCLELAPRHNCAGEH